MTYESLLINQCYLGISASTQNTLGEWEFSWTYASGSTVCRMIPITESEVIDIPGRRDDVKYRGYFLSTSSLQLGDRILFDSQYYQIMDCRYDSSHHHKVSLISRIYNV